MLKRNPLPGFGLSLGYTLLYLSIIVLLPLAALVLNALNLSWEEFWKWTTNDRAISAYKLTFGASLCAALLNTLFGVLTAWVLVRYDFPGRRFLDALVDFPFALPTAVAGLTLAELFSSQGWIGKLLEPLGMKLVFSPIGVIIALTFVGMPFVIRTLQPVIESLDKEIEEAAAILGATRIKTFTSIIFPTLFPTIITGFSLAFARAIGEYGSIVFISGNIPYKTEIAPVLIVMRLEEYNYAGATAIAVILLILSFLLLAIINWLQGWAQKIAE
ncbi:MAG: sulfate ABC transporter permease subunit CysT [Verrucomicrobiae bacterium]|nr:sulfate ABC transporter permease subunit CysT [Verrucomicrobiae bacterium]